MTYYQQRYYYIFKMQYGNAPVIITTLKAKDFHLLTNVTSFCKLQLCFQEMYYICSISTIQAPERFL